jgi:pyruvate,water dikinase
VTESWIVWPEEARAEQPLGGKAEALRQLSAAGLPVPAWCVVLPEAFDASLDHPTRDALAHASPARVRELLTGLEPSPAVTAAIDAAGARLCQQGGLLAVRSSARDEDSAEHSFAGQLESFLCVTPADLATRVADVWRSGFSQRILAYRAEVGLTDPPPAPAVLVQRLVEPQVSGVAFSADPVSGRRDQAVVSAVWGLGEALVSGAVDADTWRVGPQGEVLDARIAHKHVAHRRQAEAVRAVPLADAEADAATLEAADVARVAALARQAEALFGSPQDTEWALEGGGLYLLQSRPITTLTGPANTAGEHAVWDCSNIAENYSGVTTPLTFSFARHVYATVYREFCLLMGVPADVVREVQPHLDCMIGLVRGRMYYNLLNWYRFLSVLPGFKANREFLEHLLGVRELPASILAEVEDPDLVERALDAAHFAGAGLKTLLNFATLDRQIVRFREVLRQRMGLEHPDLSQHSPHALVAYYRDVERSLTEQCGVPALNDHSVMVSVGALRKLLRDWVGGEAEALEGALLSGGAETISGRLARRLRELADLALTRPAVVDVLLTGTLEAIEGALSAWPELERLYRAYLADFGDRFMGELKLESPTLHDDPLPLLRAIAHCARDMRAGLTDQREQEAGRRAEAEASVEAALAGHPVRLRIYRWVLDTARHRLEQRELLRYERTRVFARVRQITLELGARLSAQGVLDAPQDVLQLQLQELLDYVDGCAVTTALRDLVALRRREFQVFRESPAPPTRFETQGLLYAADLQAEAAEPPPGEELVGLGCCQGVVRGRVKVVRDPASARIEPGDVVVAEHTDPGWVLVFPAASGLLVERGNLLSHAAILARELGLPAVVSLPGLTGWLRDGDLVELDGRSGRVTKLDPDGDGA